MFQDQILKLNGKFREKLLIVGLVESETTCIGSSV